MSGEPTETPEVVTEQVVVEEQEAVPQEPDTPVNTPTGEEETAAPPSDLVMDDLTAAVAEVEAAQEESAPQQEDMGESGVKDSQYDDVTKVDDATPPPSTTGDDTASASSSISNYIPHISIGVAAAAACIGLFAMKK